MKKTVLIISGIVIILLVGGVWAYLFTYGAPKDAGEVFAKFGLGGEEVEPTIIPNTTIVDVKDTATNGTPQKLRQLTTRPVAGAHVKGTVLEYVEQGTGHLYRIDLVSGAETLVRGTTIPQTTKALFSPDGVYVVLTTYTGTEEKVIIETLSSTAGSSTRGLSLPAGATQLSFGKSPSVLSYVIQDESGTVGYTYDIKKAASVKLFTLPLRDVRMIWGEKTYAYTTPTKTQRGYAYIIQSGRLVPLGRGNFGLMGVPLTDGGIAVTTLQNGSYVSEVLGTDGTVESVVPITLIPEKCTVSQSATSTLYCTTPHNLSNNFPDDWYKGTASFSDILWMVDIENGEAVVLSNFQGESGREVDVSSIYATDTYIYFINKNDNTLWLFSTTE